MSQDKKMKPILHENHPKPITRRQFVAQGLMEASAFLIMPSVLDIILNPSAALGLECPKGAAGAGKALISIDCNGGISFGNAFPPFKDERASVALSSYDRMGLGSAALQLDNQFGHPMNAKSDVGNTGDSAADVNRFRDGLLQVTSAAARARLRIGTICVDSNDDSSNNPFAVTALLGAAGMTGKYISTPLGQRNNTFGTGGKSRGPTLPPNPFAALQIQRPADVINAVSIGGAVQNFSSTAKGKVAKAVERMTASQSSKLNRMTLGEQFSTLVQCGMARNVEFTGNISNNVDPSQDANVRAVYNLNNNREAVDAAIVMNVLKGNSSSGVLEVGGCDYHNQGRTRTNNRDFEAGRRFGQVIELAHRLGIEVMVYLFSDGSVRSQAGSPEFSGDDGSKGQAILAHYHPNTPAQRRLQIGAYTDGQGVDRNTPVGRNPAAVAYFVVANWLNIQGRLGDFYKLPVGPDFNTANVSSATLDQMIIFDKKS